MKKELTLVYILLLVVVLNTGCAPKVNSITPSTDPEPGTLSTEGDVSDNNLGYSFKYTDGWMVNIMNDGFGDANIKKVVFFQKRETDIGRSEVFIDLEFMVKSIPDLEALKLELKEQLQGSGIPVLSEDVIKVNDLIGYDLLGGIPGWKLRQVVFFAGGITYIFKYSSQEEFYILYEDTFEEIVNSFYLQ